MPESLACRLDALGPRERARHAALLHELAGSITGVTELPDGWIVRLPSRPFLFLRLAEWIELERACCPFLRIGLEFAREAGEFRVSLTGPPGAKEVVAAELPLSKPSPGAATATAPTPPEPAAPGDAASSP